MKKTKMLSLLLTGVLLLQSGGGSSLAVSAAEAPAAQASLMDEMPAFEETPASLSTEDEPENISTEETAEPENPSAAETTEIENPSAAETAEIENSSASVSAEPEDPSAAETAEPKETSSVFDIFPGLGDSRTLSVAQMEDKIDLFNHAGDIGIRSLNAKDATVADYPDAAGLYVLGEVIYIADTGEEAQMVAEAFGGELDSYSYKVAVIRLPKEATVAMAVAAASNARANLPAVWPNYYNHIDAEDSPSPAANDPYLGKQWQHEYIGTSYAWAAGYKGQGVKVAVIDTGVDQQHEDLNANALQGRDFVDGKSGVEILTDHGQHGTHVAGIIAAQENNDKGGAGIAPDATVRGYNTMNSRGTGETADGLRGIYAAIEDRNHIINMSLSSPLYNGLDAKACQDAYEAGIAIFAAAGNENTDGFRYPACYDGVISVGAVDQNSARTYFSNYGELVDLSFPGMQILSTYPRREGDHETDNNYGYMSGTSQATPAAAGTAAVILSARPDILNKTGKARVDALLEAMQSSTIECTNIGMGEGTTWLPGALKIATEMTAPDAPVITIKETPSVKSADTYLTEKVTVTLSTQAANIKDIWEIWYSRDGKVPAYKDGKVTNAEKYTGPFDVFGTGKVSIKAIAINPATGKASRLSSKNCVLMPIPTGVTITAAGNVSRVAAGKTLRLTATVTPAYAISNKVEWSIDDATTKAAGITVDKNGTIKTQSATPVSKAGEAYKVKAAAVGSDGITFNGICSEYIFTVCADAAVKKVALKENGNAPKPMLNKGETKELLGCLSVTKQGTPELKGSDAAAEVAWSSSNAKVAKVDGSGVVTAIAPGKAVIKATSNDGGNKSASCTVTVKQPVTNITLSGAVKVAAGKSITLTARVEPANATDKKLDWTVSDNSKFTVKNGKLTAKKDATGTCTVTVTPKSGIQGMQPATHTVTVVPEAITGVTLNKKSMTLFARKQNSGTPRSEQLTATVAGKIGYDQSLIEWASSAPGIASVDQSGFVTAHSAGKATITCTATDGSNKKASCTVNVSIPMSKLVIGPADSFGEYRYEKDKEKNEVYFDFYAGYIAEGKSVKMSARYSSAYGEPGSKKIKWISSNPEILKVDGSGRVTALKDPWPAEDAYIKAEALDGSGVVSNIYKFRVGISYEKLVIDKFRIAAGQCSFKVSGVYKGEKYPISYFTVNVSGGKKPAVHKSATDDGYTTLLPITGKLMTTDKNVDDLEIEDLTKQDCQKMRLTVKLMDGSGLTATRTVYAFRANSTYLCPDHLN